MAQFLNKEGLTFLVGRLQELMENTVDTKMVSNITDTSTNEQIPGAAAVWSLVIDAIADIEKVHMVVVASLPAIGENNVVYLVRVGTTDRYSMHKYIGGQWINLGFFEVDLTDYWSKDELTAMTNAEIDEIMATI